jgi:4-hydroxy-3-polyprenylbenzoate decarboxylase
MKYTDLRDFVAQLERRGELKRVAAEVDPRLEMTEICDRVLKAGGPALLFEHPQGFEERTAPAFPCSAICSARRRASRSAWAKSRSPRCARSASCLAFLKEPEPPKGLKDAWQNTRPRFMQVMQMAPKERKSAPCQEIVWEGSDVDLGACPCRRAGRATRGRSSRGASRSRAAAQDRQNLGIYRQQVIAREQGDHALARASRRRARFPRSRRKSTPGEPFPVAVALGAIRRPILGAVTPFPTRVRIQFAGLLRGSRTRSRVPDATISACRPSAEIVLEGFIRPGCEATPLRDGGRRPVRRSHRLLQRRSSAFP